MVVVMVMVVVMMIQVRIRMTTTLPTPRLGETRETRRVVVVVSWGRR